MSSTTIFLKGELINSSIAAATILASLVIILLPLPIAEAKLEREKKEDAARIETEKELAAIEKAKQEAYAETVAKIMASVTPDLVAAMTSKSNASMLETVTQAMAPYALAQGESIAEVTNRLLRGTTLEEVIENMKDFKIE